MQFSNWAFKKIRKWLLKEYPPTRSYLCDFDRISYEIRPGDVLLIEGRYRISGIIKQVTQSPWSHAALYIGRLHDIEDPRLRDIVAKNCKCSPSNQLLVESFLGEGTVISPLTKYRNDHIRICRPQGLSHSDAQKVIAFVVDRLGMKYSLRQVLDLGRFLLPWRIIPGRWHSTLFERNAGKPTEEICSSMIAEAFDSIHFPILPLVRRDEQKNLELITRNPRLFTPSDFDYSPYFAIIKYPIFPVGEISYRDLPWKEGVVSDDVTISILPESSESKESQTINSPTQDPTKP
ncbi:MAG: YiiX/YebB-like N1pC/P60 family cysteine hydrolase [Gammaproteobacteria bacterium]